MLRVLTPEEVIEGRRKLLADLYDILLGNRANWQDEFPGNFTLCNTLHKILDLWEEGNHKR